MREERRNIVTFKQSFAWWCFAQNVCDAKLFFRSVRAIGYEGVEMLPAELRPIALDEGLVIVTESAGSIPDGLNRLENHAQIEELVLEKIEAATEFGIPNLILFSGNRMGLDDETGAANTVEGLTRLAPAAEASGICLVLELLNSKVDHIDYQCDHTNWAVDVIKKVNSPNIKILYDIYHMQIMEGDVIRTIQAHSNYFGHIHTAGNPGRRDLDLDQELNYPPIMKALRENEYSGFVGQEFLPKGDALKALDYAFHLCNVT